MAANLKHEAALSVAYGAGLRASEVVLYHLEVSIIDGSPQKRGASISSKLILLVYSFQDKLSQKICNIYNQALTVGQFVVHTPEKWPRNCRAVLTNL